MTLLKQFIKLQWMHKGVMSIPLGEKSFKSSHWLNSYALVTSLGQSNIEYLLPVIWQKCLFRSTVVIVSAAVKSTNVVCSHNRTHKLTQLLYPCNLLENRFCGHSTFALQTINIGIISAICGHHTGDWLDEVLLLSGLRCFNALDTLPQRTVPVVSSHATSSSENMSVINTQNNIWHY